MRALATRIVLGAALLLSATISSAADEKKGLEVERPVLANGLRLVLSRQSAVPIVAIDCLIDGGSRVDPPNRPGLAAFTGALLEEGTKGRSSQEIARLIDSLGGSFRTGAARDWVGASAAVLARDVETGVDLVARSLREPTFEQESIDRVRAEILGELQASEESPGYVAGRAFRKAVFGDAPYGFPVHGTRSSIEAITRDEIVSFHDTWIRPERTICAVVGDVEPSRVTELFERMLGPWPRGKPVVEPKPASPSPAIDVIVDEPTTQANIIVGQIGVARTNPDYFSILLMNHILGGGGFTSRLVKTVRDEAGLAYSVISHFGSTRIPGPFEVALQTKVGSAAEAIRLIRREVTTLHESGATQAELEAAQDYLTGNFPLSLDSTTKLTSFLAQVEYFGLGDDYIEKYAERVRAVTLADVARAARQYLKPDALVQVVVGPESELAAQGLRGTAPEKTQVGAPHGRQQEEDDANVP